MLNYRCKNLNLKIKCSSNFKENCNKNKSNHKKHKKSEFTIKKCKKIKCWKKNKKKKKLFNSTSKKNKMFSKLWIGSIKKILEKWKKNLVK